jgi:hypothetical protein
VRQIDEYAEARKPDRLDRLAHGYLKQSRPATTTVLLVIAPVTPVIAPVAASAEQAIDIFHPLAPIGWSLTFHR